MAAHPPLSVVLSDDDQLVEVLAERYLTELQSGRAQDRHQWIAAHPELADQLARRLMLVDALCSLAAQRPLFPSADDRIPAVGAESARTPVEFARGGLFDPPTDPEEIGKLGKYRVLNLLGAGAMGCVFQAHHPIMDRFVAIKVITPHRMTDRGTIERFECEVKVLARLQHPNIVTAYDADHRGSISFLIMEYVEGVNLAQLLASTGPIPAARACEYIRQAALGLEHAHTHGLIHRDLKPSNLMVTCQGVVKILDLGLVRITEALTGDISSPHTPASPLLPSLSTCVPIDSRTANESCIRAMPSDTPSWQTKAHSILGTPNYMSPEQAMNPHRADVRSDIYSLGATLFHLLTGRVAPPIAARVNEADRDDQVLGLLLETLPDSRLAAVVARMMAWDAKDRYESAAQIVEALAPFAGAVQAQSNVASVYRLPRGQRSSKLRRGVTVLKRWPKARYTLAVCSLPLIAYCMSSQDVRGKIASTDLVSKTHPAAVAYTADPNLARWSSLPEIQGLQPRLDVSFEDPRASPFFTISSNEHLDMRYDAGRFVFQGGKFAPFDNLSHVRAEHLPGPVGNFVCEVVTRVIGSQDDALVLAITNQKNNNCSVQITLSGDHQLSVGTANWDPEPLEAPRVGPLSHSAIRGNGEFNRLMFALLGRKLRVFVNQVPVIESLDLKRDVAPGMVAIGISTRRGNCRLELDRVRLWKLAEE